MQFYLKKEEATNFYARLCNRVCVNHCPTINLIYQGIYGTMQGLMWLPSMLPSMRVRFKPQRRWLPVQGYALFSLIMQAGQKQIKQSAFKSCVPVNQSKWNQQVNRQSIKDEFMYYTLNVHFIIHSPSILQLSNHWYQHSCHNHSHRDHTCQSF